MNNQKPNANNTNNKTSSKNNVTNSTNNNSGRDSRSPPGEENPQSPLSVKHIEATVDDTNSDDVVIDNKKEVVKSPPHRSETDDIMTSKDKENEKDSLGKAKGLDVAQAVRDEKEKLKRQVTFLADELDKQQQQAASDDNKQGKDGDKNDMMVNVVVDRDDEESPGISKSVFRRFTKKSYEQLLIKEREKREEEELKKAGPIEEKLVDGRLNFLDEDNEVILPRDDLVEGHKLPKSLGQFPKELKGAPLEEVDPGITDKSYIVVTYRFGTPVIQRFTPTPSFFIFSPWNPIRRATVALHTNQYLDLFVILCILVNCIFLALPNYSWLVYTEYIFLSIYTFEALVKILARGFFVNSYTYLRDPWNWLDFVIVILSWVTQILLWTGNQTVISSIRGLRTLRVIRSLKTVSIVPGLKVIVNALFGSVTVILQLLIVILFALLLFTLFAIQFYAGALRNKCLQDPPRVMTYFQRAMYLRNSDNWYNDGTPYALCGNYSGASGCPVGYTCQPDIGDNPDNGYLSYDNLGWALIAIDQIFTLDNMDDLYDKTLRATGPWNVLFFVFIIFFGAFYLLNMMMAVVSLAYAVEGDKEEIEEQREKEDKMQEEEDKLKSDTSAMLGAVSNMLLTVAVPVVRTASPARPQEDGGDTVTLTVTVTAADDQPVTEDGKKPKEEEQQEQESEELPDRNCACCATATPAHVYERFKRVQDVIYIIVNDLGFELFITVVIVLNVLSMAVSFYDMPTMMSTVLDGLNYAFLSIFVLEAGLKIFAMPTTYWKSGWNIFDMIVIAASFVDVGVSSIRGLSVIRTFRLLRLLRIFKLARTWKTMRMLLRIIMKTIFSVINVTVVLLILLYIFSVMGYQLFAGTYNARWNFNDFFHAFFLIFRVVAAADCVQPLYDCMNANGLICLAIFLPTLYLGSFVVLNLFLALLLNAFVDDPFDSRTSLESKNSNGSIKTGGLDRIRRLLNGRNMLINPPPEPETSSELGGSAKSISRLNSISNGGISRPTTGTSRVNNNMISRQPTALATPYGGLRSRRESSLSGDTGRSRTHSRKASLALASKLQHEEEEEEKEAEEAADEIGSTSEVPDCFATCCYQKCGCWDRAHATPAGQRWRAFRTKIHHFTTHRAFEYTILVVIVASSITLCLNDIYTIDRPTLVTAMNYLDIAYTIIFGAEMILKMVSLGLKTYFTTIWNLLDFAIVMISIVSVASSVIPGATQISFLRAFRTLRALRPLRAATRFEGLKIIIDSLARAIPAILNVLAVCMTFWLVFDIAAVQVFGGAFWSCQDADGNILDPSVVPNMTVCQSNESKALGYQWVNYNVNFDNVLIGFVALFQVGTLQGFVAIIEHAQDMTPNYQQPAYEASFQSTWFFIAFIIVGSLFTLNLIVGVLIDNFNTLKKKTDGSYVNVLMTETQRKYYLMLKRLINKKPDKSVKRPQHPVLAFFYDVSTSLKFEAVTVLLILFNLLALVVQHYRQPASWNDILDIIDAAFTTMFVLEAIVKMIGLRWHYFRQAWNVFDLTLTLINVVGVTTNYVAPAWSIQTTTMRAVRLFRIARLLRMVKLATGIRKILFSLVISLPAIFNIAVLLFLIVFIYAVMGMNLFGYLPYQGVINDVINFQTFPNALLLMFRLTTAVSWDAVLESLMVSPPTCNPDYYTMPDGRVIQASGGSCVEPVLAIIFMVSYIALVYLIITNMYVAIILENFEMATEEEEIGVTDDDFELFYFIWEKYDPHATQFIKYEKLSDFIGELDEPLGIPKPNEIAIVAFDLDVYDGDRLHCLDILRALVKRVIGKVEDTAEFRELMAKMDRSYAEAFPQRLVNTVRTTTIHRKKEDVAAKTLQNAWRRLKAERKMKMAVQRAGAMGKSRVSIGSSNTGSQLLSLPNGKSKSGLSNGHATSNGKNGDVKSNGKVNKANGSAGKTNGDVKKSNGKASAKVGFQTDDDTYLTDDVDEEVVMGPALNGPGPLQQKYAPTTQLGARTKTQMYFRQ